MVEGLIAALADRHWTAVKISQHEHDLCLRPAETGDDDSAVDRECRFALTEELDRSGSSDTSRFLAAGAQRALWLRLRPGSLGDAMPRLRRELQGAASVIVESNSVLQFLDPELYLVVLDPTAPDIKPSVRQYLGRANAAILVHHSPAGTTATVVSREAELLNLVAGKPIFRVSRRIMCPKR